MVYAPGKVLIIGDINRDRRQAGSEIASRRLLALRGCSYLEISADKS